MVFIKDLRKDFYDVIQHQRVLVLVAFDVDALCACKILQYLFQCDQVPYTIVPVSGRQELENAYVENSEGVKYVVMINCGANFDVVEILQPEEGVVFYICDSHRPIDVCNVYNQVQVKLLMDRRDDDLQNIPEYEELFRDDESDDDSGNESETSEPSGKRRRYDEESLERRREKRLWEERKKTILFNYTQFSSHGSSVAKTMFELAWKMSKDTNDLVWLACVGVTDQFIHSKVDSDKYVDMVSDLQSHVSRHNHKGDDEDNLISVDCLKIAFESELQLTLYRHWSLFESFCHSILTACRFKVWTMRGKKKLYEFLADVGLPLVQCRQKFSAMDPDLKSDIKSIIEQKVERYGIDIRELFQPAFQAQYGFKHKYSSMDVVHASAALLESVEKGKTASDNFLDSLDVLNRTNVEAMEKGLELAKKQLVAVVTQVQTFLDMNQIISAGPFLYAFIQEGTPDCRYFSRPICLQVLAKFALEAYCAMSKNKKAQKLPLILGAPLDPERGTMLVVGIPPQNNKDIGRNFFGKAFEQSAVTTNSRTLQDSFDEPVIEMKTEDRSKFFDALISILQ